MKTTAQQYVSNSKEENSYVTVFRHYYGSTDKKVNKQGDVYALLNISADKSINAERISKFVWDSIIDGYLYSTSSTTNESLKDAIEEGVKKVKDLISNDKELGQIGINISFAILLVKEEGVYVGVFGENDVYAFKKGSVVNISDILEEKRANTAGITLDDEDVIMVSTNELLSNNLSRLSVLKKKEDFLRTLDAIGANLNGTKSLLYFAKGEERKNIAKQRKRIIPNMEEMKSSAEKFLKPIARVERIKKPKEQKIFSNFEGKGKLREILLKIKSIAIPIYEKIKVILLKIGGFIKEKLSILMDSVTENLGKKRWYKKLASRFSEIRITRRKPVGVAGMRIDDYKVRDLRGRRFKVVLMVVLVITLLALGINFTIKMRHEREISKLAGESFTQIEDLIRKSEENSVVDRATAETYLFQAENLLNEVPKELNEEDTVKFNELKVLVLGVGDSLYKRIGIIDNDGKLATFLDTRLAFGEGSDVVDVASYKDSSGNEYLVVADKGKKSVFRVSMYDKSVKALPDNEGMIKEPQHVYVGVNGVYVYDLKEGMLKASFDEEGWFSAFARLSGLGVDDIEIEDIVEMTVWTDSDNVYFLSKDKKSLLKSTPAYGDRYGLTYSYFGDESMALATDMVADLSIYITISEEPHIVRFNYSFYENEYYNAPLSVINFDGNYGNLTKAFTGDSMEFGLYLFDSEGKRFLRFEKPIESGADEKHPNQISLLGQYLYRGEKDTVFGDVRNFVVDTEENSIYILDGSVIWKLGL